MPQRLGYFDFKNDIFLLESRQLDELEELSTALDLSEVQHLALTYRDKFEDMTIVRNVIPQLCPKLKSLSIVYGAIHNGRNPLCFFTEHLLEIDESMRDIHMNDFTDRHSLVFTDEQRQEQISSYLDIAKDIKERFATPTIGETADGDSTMEEATFNQITIKNEFFWNRVDFRVTLVGENHDDPYYWEPFKDTFLQPKKPEYHGVVFYLSKPKSLYELVDRDNWVDMRIEELDCESTCKPDGTLVLKDRERGP
jgi:hypothetical protein